ncbi:Uridine nucleosidase 1 [Aphelenchoides fujianensis]|nr:Uridine nucleosidase 1 [Aphelenchoides fujianensis]
MHWAVVLLLAVSAAAAQPPVRLVIDTDGAADDAMGISLALQSAPHVQVVAFSTVSGGTTAAQAVATVARTIRATGTQKQASSGVFGCGSEIPIFKGAKGPLIGGINTTADSLAFFGFDGISDLPDNFPQSLPSDLEAFDHSVHAATGLIRMFGAQPGELTLVAIGPLTNIALALKLEPEFAKWPKKLVLTGGNVFAKGNVRRSSTSEFNFNTDPEAAYIVLREMECDIVMQKFDFDRHYHVQTPLGDYFRTVSTLPRAAMASAGLPFRFCDEITVAAAIWPERVITRSQNMSVIVELSGQFTRGQVAVGWADDSFGSLVDSPMRPALLVMDYDVEEVDRLLTSALERSASSTGSSTSRPLGFREANRWAGWSPPSPRPSVFG